MKNFNEIDLVDMFEISTLSDAIYSLEDHCKGMTESEVNSLIDRLIENLNDINLK